MKVSVNNIVLSCEHASHDIPAEYRYLFKGSRALLISHRGWDPGALECAIRLADNLHAPLIKGDCSRLLIDLNRSLHHQQVFSEFTRALLKTERLALINSIYHPYHTQLQQTIARCIAKCGFALHLSIHSFTPVMNGNRRDADIGLLYDPRRQYEAALASRLKECLQNLDRNLKIRRNYPYRGIADGATSHYRKFFADKKYAGLEIEINQRYPLGNDRKSWKQLQNAIIKTLNSAFHDFIVI